MMARSFNMQIMCILRIFLMVQDEGDGNLFSLDQPVSKMEFLGTASGLSLIIIIQS
jgi:hypothetical protein